jgi:hyperosmotically inducible protein
MMRARRRIFGLISAGFLAIALSACTGGTTSESTGQYIDSATITAKVKAGIAKASDLSVFSIGVTTYKNIVQLSGFVNTQAQKDHAGQIARSVQGVAGVENNITVKQ